MPDYPVGIEVESKGYVDPLNAIADTAVF